ncbi:MAG: hypothetical protein PQJ61_00460 [Spirochaetales bacterium]|uniref:Uncharacterized protein n=1 Tax=Candidatus Thalassospirochaeta sargassi TaxID=3119039 RepID=A0AAJ1MKV8_9SPIO|nr:hypothetical protein [Spirochaetales bacterium]
MKEENESRDGIIISDKPVWEMTIKEHLITLIKRCIALPSKLIGFKPLCFLIATKLLVGGFIDQWIWLIVLVIVMFGIVGLKITSRILSNAGKVTINTVK